MREPGCSGADAVEEFESSRGEARRVDLKCTSSAKPAAPLLLGLARGAVPITSLATLGLFSPFFFLALFRAIEPEGADPGRCRVQRHI